jgi:hypothetical protein
MPFGIRLIIGLVVAAAFLYFTSQLVTDPLQILVFGFGSEILGFVTFSIWKINLITLVGGIGTILLILPLGYIILMAPIHSLSQSIAYTTDWLVSYFQGLPASIIGDVGGMFAAAIVGT